MKNGVFWYFLYIATGLTAIMLVLYVFNTLIIKDRLPESGYLASLKSFSDLALPIIGNTAFLPIIATMVEVFICTETSGNDIHDAYLHVDCYEVCWESYHLTWVGISSLCLVFYVPVAVYMRPKW